MRRKWPKLNNQKPFSFIIGVNHPGPPIWGLLPGVSWGAIITCSPRHAHAAVSGSEAGGECRGTKQLPQRCVRGLQGTSPIYNLLPDMLTLLSVDPALSPAQFQDVMSQLLAYIKKDRLTDSLVEKLCARFAGTRDTRQWRNIAFCLTQVCESTASPPPPLLPNP